MYRKPIFHICITKTHIDAWKYQIHTYIETFIHTYI